LSLVGPGLVSPIDEDVPLVGTPPEPELVWAFAVVATAKIATDAAASNVGIRIRVFSLSFSLWFKNWRVCSNFSSAIKNNARNAAWFFRFA